MPIVATGNCNAYTGLGDPYLPFLEILGLLTADVEARLAAGAIDPEQVRRLQQFFPIARGEVQEMRQYIHYHLERGKIASVGCAIAG